MLPIDTGIWLFAFPLAPNEVIESGVAVSGDDAAKPHLERLVGNLKPDGSTDYLYISRYLFDRYLASSLDDNGAGRKARFSLTSVDGDWHRDDWDTPVGDGGIVVNPKGPGSVWVEIQTLASQVEWQGNKGVRYNLPLHIEASAGLSVRVDPGPGGGFKVDMTVDGALSGTIGGQLTPSLAVGEDGVRRLVFENTADCNVLILEAETGGEITVGVRMPIQSGNLLGQTLDLPLVPIEQSVELDVSKWSTPDTEIDGAVVLEGQLVVEELALDEFGAALGVRFGPADDRAVAGNQAPVQQRPSACPDAGSPKLLIAGQDFGPNNEIVKVLKAFADLHDDAKKAVIDAAKEIAAISTELNDALADVGLVPRPGTPFVIEPGRDRRNPIVIDGGSGPINPDAPDPRRRGGSGFPR